MHIKSRRLGASIRMLAFLTVIGGAAAAPLAQPRSGPPDGPGPRVRGEGAVTPADIQRLFDAYVVMQSQEAVGVGEEQYPRFLTRLRALQDARRRGQVERTRIMLELRRLTRDQETPPDEAAIKAQLKALDEAETRSSSEIKVARDALDQVMDLRQQARFRLFEEQMERRKVELLMRARQSTLRQRDRF